MADDKITLMDGRLHIYRRPNSRYWQCSTYLLSRNFRTSTKQESIPLAKEFAVEWYMEVYAAAKRSERGETVPAPTYLRGGHPDIIDRRRRPVASGPTFKQAADAFVKEYAISVQGERNESYVAQKELTIRVHLLPFFGAKALNEITAGLVQDYRVHRQTSRKNKKGEVRRPSRSTLHQEIVCLRQILKLANRKGWLAALPDMSVAYKASGKITHRAWFSPDEYQALHEAIGEKAENPPKERWRSHWQLLHDYVLVMANTGLRVDEAANLQYRDIAIITDEQRRERILEIEVRGKRGVGYCKSMPGAVFPFERLRKRVTEQRGGVPPLPTDHVFGKVKRGLLNSILDKLGLKHDRDGQVRTAGSLRHTYICLRLTAGADVYQIAKNCRTSVEMIERFYATHIKNMLDASQINVRRPKPRRAAKEEASP
jgi:integrase